ncbi:type II toxin-antitoxin system RelE/ParE family toxin [Mesorhizobium sp. L-8-10]
MPQEPCAGHRRRVHGNYLIFYRASGENVEILHVLHGAMDYERILFPED